MTDKTKDQILEGLYALVERAEADQRSAEPPVSQTRLFGDASPPNFPRLRPGTSATRAANAAAPPMSVRFRGL